MAAAVVGAGYWGPNLVRTALATPAFRLDWLCDLQVERARGVLGSYTTVRVTSSYDSILADPNVAAVAIATPAATHFDLVRSALEAGKHVMGGKAADVHGGGGRGDGGAVAALRASAAVRRHVPLYPRPAA